MASSPSKRSTETLLIDQTIGKTVYDASKTIAASGLEGMVVAGTNVINISQSSPQPVNPQEIDYIFKDILKKVLSLVDPEKHELTENLILSLQSEAYKGDNAQVDTVEIILRMIADVGKRPFVTIYETFTLPDCPLAPVFRDAACRIGQNRFSLNCPQNSNS